MRTLLAMILAATAFGQHAFQAPSNNELTTLENRWHPPAPPAPPPPTPKPTPPPTQSVPGPICLTVACWNAGTIATGLVTMTNIGSSLAIVIPEVANFVPEDSSQPHVNYLRTPFSANLSGGSCNLNGVIVPYYCLTGTVEIITTGNPTFNFDVESGDDCTSNCMPASLHFLLEQANDACLCNATYRWWYDVYFPLADGTFTFTIPLNPEDWTDVYDDPLNIPAFDATLTHMGQIGFTCGGGWFDGHGCSVSGGTAQMVITSFAITQ